MQTQTVIPFHPHLQNASILGAFNDNVDRFESDEHEPALRKWLRATGKI